MLFTASSAMFSRDEVGELARLAGLAPGTLAWMSEPPPMEASPPPPSRYAYAPLSGDEWEAIAPHWPTHNQARTTPRDIVNGLLKIASTGCGWRDAPEFATDEALRQQWQRRK